jgi:YcxB-like protein
LTESNADQETIFLWVRYLPEEVNQGYWLAYVFQRLALQMVLSYAWAAILAFGYVQYSVLPEVDDFFQPDYLPTLLIAVVGIPLTVCAIIWIVIRSRTEKSFYIRPNFHFPMLYLIDRDGIRMQFASGSGLIEWRYFNLLIETGDSFALVSTPREVFVLPKRCFSSREEVAAAKKLLVSKIRTYKKVGRDRDDIVFGKQAISSVIIDGQEFPVPGMLQGLNQGDLPAVDQGAVSAADQGAEPAADQSAVSAADQSAVPSDSSSDFSAGTQSSPIADSAGASGGAQTAAGADANGDFDSSAAAGATAKVDAPVVIPGSVPASASAKAPAYSGLVVECTYQDGEIKEAQRVYFFRKVLPRLGLVYLALGLGAPLLTSLIGWVWNVPEMNQLIWGPNMQLLAVVLPLYLVQSWTFYRRTVRAPDNDRFKNAVGFSFNSAGCSMRTGEHYSMLAWLHFVECWETDSQFMLLFGSGGRAMYVIPKRVFDSEQLQYLAKLLQKNVRRYRVLM